MLRFAILVFLSGVLILGGMVLAQWLGFITLMPSFGYESVILMGMITIVLYRYLRKVKPDMFVQLYLLSMVVKMLAAGIFCFIIALLDRPGSMINLVFFMTVYVIFTTIEIGFLYKK